MNKNLRYIFAAAMMAISGSTVAQNLNSAYFLEGYTQGHELNPAKDYERQSYFSMPFLGNINVGLTGSLNLNSILMKNPNGTGLTTFMNPNIPASEALSGFSKGKNTLNEDLRMDILSFGFHKWGGFNTFNLSLRSTTSLTMPYELFEALKDLQNKDYNIGNIGMRSTEWVEFGLGHSRQINDAWRVGGKLKILLGLGRAQMEVNNLRLNLSAPEKWVVSGDANVEAAIKGFTWGEMKHEEYKSKPGGYDHIDFGNMDVKNPGLNGAGAAVDLGAEWDLEKQGLLDGMKVSAALLDLGFINWKNVAKATNYSQSFEFEGFHNIQIKDGEGDKFGDQSDKLGDNLGELVNLKDAGTGSGSSAIGTTLNIGVEYRMPFYDKLKAGFLSTTRIQGKYSWNEERISATVSPLNWLEGSVNLGFGSFGASFGWVANIHTKGFSLVMGMDRTLGKLSKQGIPLKSSSNVSLGINFPLGKRM